MYDGIILGAGHNSLVLQAYLGRAGLKVLCLERRGVSGGGLATEEDGEDPGFLHNPHSFYHRALTRMPWYRDLELERRGAVYVEPELNAALILRSGEALEWWTDFEKTIASFERFSARDAATLRRWRDAFLPIVENILIPEGQSPPLPPERRAQLLLKSAEGRLLLEVSALSPLEFVQHEIQHPAVRAGLLFFNGLREVDLRSRGFGHHIPALLASPGKAQMCVGGSAALARALGSAVHDSGGTIGLGRTPARILVKNGAACGVETTDGEMFAARYFVASGLNPQQTFLGLIDEEVLPRELRDKAREYKYNLLAPLFGLYLTLNERPRYTAERRHPELAKAFMVILGLEDSAQFEDIVRCHENGTIPPTVMWGSSPTVFDSSQAPPNGHTAFMWEKLPFRLDGDARNWDAARSEHGRAMLRLWSEYAPDLPASVRHWHARSPLDVERALPNMQGGDLLVGSLADGQVGFHRPFQGAGRYRAGLQGLYLCGSCTHPGGNITGLPGYNCAQVILKDLGIPAEWAPPPIEQRLEHL